MHVLKPLKPSSPIQPKASGDRPGFNDMTQTVGTRKPLGAVTLTGRSCDFHRYKIG